jgi:hypothetical protein
MWGALSDKRTGLSFTTAAGPRQPSHSRVRVLQDSWPLSQIRDSPNLEGQVPVFISPQTLGSLFVASYDSQGYGGGIRNRLHTGIKDWIPSVFYIQIQFVPHRKHYVSATEPNRLMLFRETVAVYCENRTGHTNTLCGQNAEFQCVEASDIIYI